jgi:hypothetical protein
MKKFLVIGDSFAYLDNDHSNWVSLWAKKHDASTEHHSVLGGSHVTIVNDFFNKNHDLSNVTGIFYFATDLLRGEGVELSNPTENLEVIDKISSDSRLWRNILTGSDNKSDWPIDHKIITQQIGNYEYTDNFYNSINIKWLINANYNSMIMLLLYARIHSKPVIVIDSFGQIQDNEISNNLKVITWRPDISSYDSASLNHVSISTAYRVANDFDISLEKNSILCSSKKTEEERTKEMLERVRKRDPFIYR